LKTNIGQRFAASFDPFSCFICQGQTNEEFFVTRMLRKYFLLSKERQEKREQKKRGEKRAKSLFSSSFFLIPLGIFEYILLNHRSFPSPEDQKRTKRAALSLLFVEICCMSVVWGHNTEKNKT
jgi:hypothetical protein